MNKENYMQLVEIQGLQLKIKEHLDHINSHQKRIDDLKELREEKQLQLTPHHKLLTKISKEEGLLEKETYHVESRLKKAKEHYNLSADEKQMKATGKEIDELSIMASELEEKTLLKLEEMETIQKEIKVLEQFILGSKQSLEEIKKEVQVNIESEKTEIKNYEIRINALKEQLPNIMKQILQEVNIKYIYNHPLSKIKNLNCEYCGIQMDRTAESSLQNMASIQICAGCGRILLPTF